jgi:hypothetical protein
VAPARPVIKASSSVADIRPVADVGRAGITGRGLRRGIIYAPIIFWALIERSR